MATKIQGLDRLRRKIRQMPKAVKDQIRTALEKSADEIVAMAKSLVPVDTGRLRDSIAWTWGDGPEGAVVLAQSGSTDSELRITIYAGVRGNNLYDQGWYVRFVEFGTQKMGAQPFFFPSYRANKKRARGRITRAINKAVKEVASS